MPRSYANEIKDRMIYMNYHSPKRKLNCGEIKDIFSQGNVIGKSWASEVPFLKTYFDGHAKFYRKNLSDFGPPRIFWRIRNFLAMHYFIYVDRTYIDKQGHEYHFMQRNQFLPKGMGNASEGFLTFLTHKYRRRI